MAPLRSSFCPQQPRQGERGQGPRPSALGPRPSARPSRNAETKAGDKDPPKLRCHLRAKMQTGVGGKHGQAEADFSTVSPVWLCE